MIFKHTVTTDQFKVYKRRNKRVDANATSEVELEYLLVDKMDPLGQHSMGIAGNMGSFHTISRSNLAPLESGLSIPVYQNQLLDYLQSINWFHCREILTSSDPEEKMVQTRHNTEGSSNPADPVAEQLAAIASKLEAMDSLQADMAALKRRVAAKDKAPFGGGRFDEAESGFSNAARRPFHKIYFPSFNGGDPRGWILKAEKYFRFYNTLDEEKVDVAAIHLEGDALDFYSWISTEQDITYWEELTAALQKHFGPPEFQNPDEYLCSVKQTGTIMEYRQEFTRRSSRVNNWPDHCLLGVFLNGLKDELKADVRIHKPRTVYKAVNLAMEFESKLNSSKPERKTSYPSQLRPD
ncbi:hypothetical protein E3N88_18191 [Mikania micrantha]|uniref:Retrotransposon gag domain-containing protein n=1 Tax=Mikania micrantha TaxID=192012 RepID=A0A5N6NW82_9ASTR|nr:hypothetical protein E3N88_18191 [Mikania micrantha]